jgi:hypothetical protein
MASVVSLPSGARGVHLELEEVETALLRSLAAQLLEFVAPESGEHEDPLVELVGLDPSASTPEDPALKRLLPDAYRDDADASSQFRRYTERDLRARKARSAQLVIADLDAGGQSIDISGDGVDAWLGFLNDTRLTLGVRLDITEESHDELASLPEDDPRATLFQVYDWLTFLQESLVQRLLMSD